MADDCEKHRGSTGQTSGLEAIMTDLPENQSGAGRHKCPYCAYERGVLEGRESERNRIAKFFDCSPSELE